MSNIIAFLSGMAATFLLSCIVVLHLSPHLKKVLIDLCGTEERAKFWTVFSNLSLILMPLFTAMHYYPNSREGASIFFEIITQFNWGLVGLLSSILAIGIVIKRYIPSNQPLRQVKL